MPRRACNPDEIVKKLRRIELAIAQGAPARRAIKKAGISHTVYYRWRREYGGMNADQVMRLIELKTEIERLRREATALSRALVWKPPD